MRSDKLKKLIFSIVILSILFLSPVNFAQDYNELNESKYMTLQGNLHDLGTGEAPLLIFESDSEYYIVDNDSRLNNLKGIPLLLTGKITKLENGPFKGRIEVIYYNSYYESDWDEASILGKLVENNNTLFLLTKDQIVIKLDSEKGHSLFDYIGEDVLINGSLNELEDYSGSMKVKSYRVIE